jgi:hypothetical protein
MILFDCQLGRVWLGGDVPLHWLFPKNVTDVAIILLHVVVHSVSVAPRIGAPHLRLPAPIHVQGRDDKQWLPF